MRNCFILAALVLLVAGMKDAFAGPICDFFGMAYGNGAYVAVGCLGEIYNSTNGTNWSPVTYAQTPNILYAVAYGGGEFVAVGENGWTAISSDGTNWASADSGATIQNLFAVTYGSNQFVAVGNNGAVITSPDGSGWTLQSLGVGDTNDTLFAVTYGNDLFVALGLDNFSYTSRDGVTWARANTGLSENFTTGLAFGQGLFVVSDDSGSLSTSTDGMNWSTQARISQSISSVAYGDGLFVAAINNTLSYVSPDGTNWTVVPGPTVPLPGESDVFYAVIYNAGNFYFGGQNGDLGWASVAQLVPPIGAQWEIASYNGSVTDTNDNLSAVVYGNDQFLAIGSDAAAFESIAGENWSQETLNAGEYYRGIAYGNVGGGTYVAVNNAGQISILTNNFDSPASAVWNEIADALLDLEAVTFGNSEFVAVGQDSSDVAVSLTSPDGIVWTQHDLAVSSVLVSVVYDGTQFVAVGDDGTVVLSPDGETWTTNAFPSDVSLYGIAYGGGLYVVVGSGGALFTSPDAKTWTTPTNYLSAANDLYSVAYSKGYFVAVGEYGLMVTSTDGVNWTSRNSPTLNSLRSVAAGNGNFTTVGDNGAILSLAQTPIILTEPSATAYYLTSGGFLSLTATAQGLGPITYQWQFGGNNLAGGAHVIGANSTTLTLSNVDLSFGGQYDLVIANPYGSVTTRVVNVNIGIAPTITTQPTAQAAVALGTTVTLSGAAQGSSPMSYTWSQLGGRLDREPWVSGASTPTLVISNIVPTNAGTYYLTVENPYGSVRSANVTVKATPESTSPTIAIAQPGSKGRSLTFMVDGLATDAVAVGNIRYVISNNVSFGAPISGLATATPAFGKSVDWSIPAAIVPPGSNTLTVIATNFSGKAATNSRSFFRESSATFSLVVEGPAGGTVTGKSFFNDTAPAVGQTQLNIGEGYQLTATPATNWHLVGWMEHGGVVETSNVFDFLMDDNLVITAVFATNNFSGASGIYFGDFYCATNATNLTVEKTGYINLALGSDGSYAARLALADGRSFDGLSGQFDYTTGTATSLIGRETNEGGGDILLTLTFDFQSVSPGVARQISATVQSTNGVSLDDPWTASAILVAEAQGTPQSAFYNHAFLYAPSQSATNPPQWYGGGLFSESSLRLENSEGRSQTFPMGLCQIYSPFPTNSGDWVTFAFGTVPPGYGSIGSVIYPVGEDGTVPIMMVGNGSIIVGRVKLFEDYSSRTQFKTNLDQLTWIAAAGAIPGHPDAFQINMDVIACEKFNDAFDFQPKGRSVGSSPTNATVTISGGGLTNDISIGVLMIADGTTDQSLFDAGGSLDFQTTSYEPDSGRFTVKFVTPETGEVTAKGQMITGPSVSVAGTGVFLGGGAFYSTNGLGSITIVPIH